MPPLPSKQDYDEIVRRLKAAQTALTPKVQELRDVADWQRWANVGIQEQLCEKMEALKTVEDPEEIAQAGPRAAAAVAAGRRRAARAGRSAVAPLQDGARRGVGALRGAFRGAGAKRAPRTSRRRSRCASGPRRSPSRPTGFRPPTRSRSCRPSGRRSARSRAARKRRSGSASAPPAIASSPAATTISPSARRCGPRTSRRRKRSAPRPRRSPTRPTGTTAAAEIKRLQAEWKTIGPVKKSRSEAIWQRFRGACDRFFARYAQRHDIARGERVAAREAICAELEALAPSRGPEMPTPSRAAAPRSASADGARALRGRWQQELARARRRPRSRARRSTSASPRRSARVIARWPAVFGGTDLDPDANRKRMEALVAADGRSRRVARRPGARRPTRRCRRRRGSRRC